MFQEVTIIGNLGNDPELRYTPSGKAVCNMSVATNRKWTDGSGEQQEETVWFRVAAWGKMGEACNSYLSKGRQVFVKGRLVANEHGSPRIWEDNNGNARASFEINASEVKFLSGGRNDNGGSTTAQEPAGPDITDEEIPFS
jgi:single-strand DNA-binding protein